MGKGIFDIYTFYHFSAGLIAGVTPLSLQHWIILNIIFELIENRPLGMRMLQKISFWPGGKNTPDSLQNSISDIIAATIGYIVSKNVKKKLSNKQWSRNGS